MFGSADPMSELLEGADEPLQQTLAGVVGDDDLVPYLAQSGGPNPFAAQFAMAARAVGVPLNWVTSSSLVNLITRESSWRPTAKNPTSMAFGLGQFLKSTWKQYLPEVPYGTTDPYWQAVGILRYIRARYGSPEKAWNFWTKNRWY